ncbi:hypothetical protein [Allosphingosinicella vermicomposti]|uniref:hypothetical protein n=1 Tax=Allosphingosinicella vermicomposti TaxID=614671 RepID=UPI000D0F7EFD|nr:hypothetical protein [Allosphingosinicella vermicomposti]
MKFIFGLCATALIAACDSGASENDVQPVEVPQGDYQARLMTMPEGQRNAVFIRAIRDAGRDCQNVERSAFQGERNGQPVWAARCGDGQDWVIVIGRDGIAQIANSQELETASDNASLP